MFIVLDEVDVNLDSISRIFVRRTSKNVYTVKGEMWGPIVCMKKLRYKEFLVDFYSGSESDCKLFRTALMQMRLHQDEVVTVDQVVELMEELKNIEQPAA